MRSQGDVRRQGLFAWRDWLGIRAQVSPTALAIRLNAAYSTANPLISHVDQHALDSQILVNALRAALPAKATALDSTKRRFAGAEHAQVDSNHPATKLALRKKTF
jgi:hypothetical protein